MIGNGGEDYSCGAGTAYVRVGKRTIIQDLMSLPSTWYNLAIDDPSRLRPPLSEFFPEPGTYGARSTGTDKVHLTTGRDVSVEFVEVAPYLFANPCVDTEGNASEPVRKERHGRTKLVIVGGRSKGGEMAEIESMYGDAVVIHC